MQIDKNKLPQAIISLNNINFCLLNRNKLF